MNNKWQIANEQVGIFWATVGVNEKKISKQYPLTIDKLKKRLKNCEYIHLLIEENENLTSEVVEDYLIKHDLIKSENEQSDNLSNILAGALYAIDDSGIIFIPNNGHEPRRLFSLAHELGHYFIEIYIPFKESKNEPNPKRLYNRDPIHRVEHDVDGSLSRDSLIEFKANQFAAELLMPRKMVIAIARTMQKGKKRKISREKLVEKIVKKFGVSAKAAEYRTLDLEIPVK